MNAREAALTDLEERLGYAFANRTLLDRALTHSSIGEGARSTQWGPHTDNERLEFLGDRVLGLMTAETLIQQFGDAREGDLALRLNALVNRDACAAAARRMGLGPALRLASSETRAGGREKPSILADACEAVIAAAYLDGGLPAARTLYQRFWREAFAELDVARSKDAKTALQEQVQSEGKPVPKYRVISRDGPDHAPIFTVEAVVAGLVPSQGCGASRQAAEKAAAQALLDREYNQ